jgi:acetyl/propionyl-CoA carboxylase alpha subunit
MKLVFDYNSQSFPIDLTLTGKSYRATLDDKTVDVEIIRADAERGQLELLIDGERVIAYVSSDAAKRWVTVNGRTVVLTKSSGAKRSGAGQDQASELAAPMPGVIRGVNVGEGESVTKGQTLMVLEAMKMEIRIQAPFDGVVKSLAVKVGQTVEREQILIVLER